MEAVVAVALQLVECVAILSVLHPGRRHFHRVVDIRSIALQMIVAQVVAILAAVRVEWEYSES